jgi:DNA-binding response OmpR family regulator
MAKIMIVEDNPVHNLLLCHGMEDLNHQPMPFFFLDKAKEELLNQEPDLLIIDVELNGGSKANLAFIIELSNSAAFREIPIIIISAYVSKEDIKKELPFFDLDYVIEKPFDVETITSKVRTLLKKKKRVVQPDSHN